MFDDLKNKATSFLGTLVKNIQTPPPQKQSGSFFDTLNRNVNIRTNPKNPALQGTLLPETLDQIRKSNQTFTDMLKNRAPLGSPEAIKDTVSSLFTMRDEPVEVRRPFEKTPIKTNLPPVITGAAKFGNYLVELVPKVTAQAVANFSPSQETTLSFDKKRLGFQGEGNTIESTGRRMVDDFDRRMEDSPDTVKTNILMSSLVPVSDAFDAFVAGDILTSAARQGLNITKYDKVLNDSLARVGLDSSTVNIQTLKEQFMNRAQSLIRNNDIKALNELGQSTNYIAQKMTGEGITNLNKLGEFIQNLSKNLLKDMGSGESLIRPLGYRAQEGLPGYRNKPGQAPAMGMSTKEVEGVGFGKNEKLSGAAREKYGKDFMDLSKSEMKDIASKNNGEVILSKDADMAAKKFATAKFSKDTLEIKPELLFGGLKNGVFTDSFSLISNKEAANEILGKELEKKKLADTKKLVEQGTSHTEATTIVNNFYRQRAVDVGDGFPDWKQIMPKGESTPVEFQGTNFDRVTGPQMVFQSGDKIVAVNADYYANMRRALPDHEIGLSDNGRMLTFSDGKKIEGLLMSINKDVGELKAKFADTGPLRDIQIDKQELKAPTPTQTPKAITAKEAVEQGLTEEQYVKGHQSIYRADSQAFNAKLVKPDGNTPGTYFATNKSYATDYANGGRKVSEYFVRKDAKILKYNDLPLELQKKPTLTKDTAFESKRIYDYAKSKGYDAVQSEVPTKVNKNTAELTVINPDVVKTSSQLRTEYAEELAKVKAPIEKVETPAVKERKYITSAKSSAQISQEVAQSIDETYTPKQNSELVKNAIERVETDFEAARKFALENSSDEATATGVAVEKQLSLEYENATDLKYKADLAQELTDSLIAHSRILTEAGRTIQAASLLGKNTPTGILRNTVRLIDKHNKTARVPVPQITPESVKKILDKGITIEKLPENSIEREKLTNEIVDELSRLIPTKQWRMLVQVWKAGLLTGIKTTGINLSSTFFNGVMETVKDVPAWGVDLAVSLITKQRTKVNPFITLKSQLKGVGEGFKKGATYLRHGVSEEQPLNPEYAKVNFDKWGMPGKVLQVYSESVFRVLGAEDFPFFYSALRRSLSEQAQVKIINTKMKFSSPQEKEKWIQDFINNPPADAHALADIDAKIATFKNDTALGNAATSVKNAFSNTMAAPFVETVLPFTKVPSSVAMQMVDYSPLGAVHTFYENFYKNKFDQKSFAEGLGRVATGAAALWLGYKMYKSGRITLGYPSDEKERAEQEALGIKPNSILIGGKYIPLITFGPVGSLMGVGGYVSQGYDQTGSLAGGFGNGLAGGTKSLTEQTFLTGVKDIMDTINDPEKKVQGYTNRLIGSIVPTIIADTANAFDKLQRKPQGVIDTLKVRTGIDRKSVPAKLNVYGEVMERNRTAVGTALNPIRLSNTTETKLTTEVERLEQAGEDVRLTKIDAKIGHIPLEKNEHWYAQKKLGDMLVPALTEIIDSEEYQQMDPEEQAEVWKDTTKELRAANRENILPVIIKKRYNLDDDTDAQFVSEFVDYMYETNEKFRDAPRENQEKYLKAKISKGLL